MITTSVELLNEVGGHALATLAQLLMKSLPMLTDGTGVRIVFFSSDEMAAAWDRAVDNGHVIEVKLKRCHGRDQAFNWIEATSRYYQELPAHLKGHGRARLDGL